MTDYSPRRRRPPAAPNSIVHEGFGRYRRTDAAGKVTGEVMTKAQANAGSNMGEVSDADVNQSAARPSWPDDPVDAQEKPASRRRRASVGGHSLKLEGPSRPGFVRRWFNDDGNRLATADELGYEHVSDTGLQTSGPGSRVSRLVGTKANGEPLHAFLMETPDELYAEGLADKEAAARQVDDAIKAGRDSTGQMSPTETYGHGSISSDR